MEPTIHVGTATVLKVDMGYAHMKKRPLINTPIDKFLEPVLREYERSGIRMSFDQVRDGVLYLHLEKGCGG